MAPGIDERKSSKLAYTKNDLAVFLSVQLLMIRLKVWLDFTVKTKSSSVKDLDYLVAVYVRNVRINSIEISHQTIAKKQDAKKLQYFNPSIA